MKKFLSLIMAVVFAFGMTMVGNNEAFAAEKMHIEDELIALEKNQGYIPGKTSSKVYNCFAFVSDVCEKLYGVTYYYERQIDNYQYDHTSNYYTVSKLKLDYSSDLSAQKEKARQIRDWLLENAAAGDILQYGSASSAYSKRHTVLIQHIDDKKICVLHSNYETGDIPASACRLDTIYFDNFVSNPLSNDYDSKGNIKSMNYIFGSQLKLTQGCGMSLNRFTSLESKYYLDKSNAYICKINKTERASCTSVKLYWNSVPGANVYSVDYKLSTASKWTNASKTVTTTNYVVDGLKTGKEYSFRVRAQISGSWQEYSQTANKTVLPPKPANITIKSDSSGIQLNWAKRNDITGVLVFRSEKGGEFTQVADLLFDASAYRDTDLKLNTVYSYKIQRYLILDGVTHYSEMSPVFSSSILLSAPDNILVKSSGKSSIYVKWDAQPNATSYIISYAQTGSSDYKKITTKKTGKTIPDLQVGKKYKIRVRSKNIFGGTSNSQIIYCTVKPNTPKVTTSVSSGKAKVSWSTDEKVSGYVIYRSDSKNGKYELVKTINSSKTTSYKDKKTSKGNKYFYKVKSFVKRDGKAYYSDMSSPKSVKIS